MAQNDDQTWVKVRRRTRLFWGPPRSCPSDGLAGASPAAVAGKGCHLALHGISSNGIEGSPPCWLTLMAGAPCARDHRLLQTLSLWPVPHSQGKPVIVVKLAR